MNFVEISLPVNFDNVNVEIQVFDIIKSIVNKMVLPVSQEISVSILRSASMPSQVRTLVGYHTYFSEMTIKPGLVNEFETKVNFSRVFSKALPIFY